MRAHRINKSIIQHYKLCCTCACSASSGVYIRVKSIISQKKPICAPAFAANACRSRSFLIECRITHVAQPEKAPRGGGGNTRIKFVFIAGKRGTVKVLLLGGSLATLGSSRSSRLLSADLVGPGNALRDLEGSASVALGASEAGLLHGRLGVLGVLGLLGSLLGLAVGSGGDSSLADGVVDLVVHGFKSLAGFKIGLDVAGELIVVLFTAFTVTLELLHVRPDVDAEDVLPVNLSVVLAVNVSGEAVVGVGNVQAAINSALEHSEDAGTSGGAAETDIQNDLEGVLLPFSSFEIATVGVVPAKCKAKTLENAGM